MFVVYSDTAGPTLVCARTPARALSCFNGHCYNVAEVEWKYDTELLSKYIERYFSSETVLIAGVGTEEMCAEPEEGAGGRKNSESDTRGDGPGFNDESGMDVCWTNMSAVKNEGILIVQILWCCQRSRLR
jgi:hypothetical protein